ncbi:MAG: hypothetical protein ACTHQQ_20605 [Solirubrobacteraceae bacterium]
MADRAYTDADLDAAIAALSEPGRLRAAQDLVARAAPALHRVLDEAIDQGGWFDNAHEQALREATGEEDPGLRALAVRTLVAEETRLGMFVGVTVGFELARELSHALSPGEPPLASPAGRSTESQKED